MTREEAKKILEAYIACESKKAHFECSEYNCDDTCPLLYDMGTVGEYNEAINMAIQALEQEPNRDIKEIAEIMKCDADAETKCKMISNILTAKPHYFEEQDPCEKCNYVEGSPFCLQYCPYDAERKKEQEPCEDISPTAVPVTIEEAKRLLQAEWKKEISKDKSNSRLLVAYKMAVQFLEQEPCDDEDDGWIDDEYGRSIRLEQNKIEVIPPLEPCDDAISRQAVLSKIKEVCFSEEWIQFRINNGSNGQRDFLIDYIEQLPPVTQKSNLELICEELAAENDKLIEQLKQKQKSGKWINIDDIESECSECGHREPNERFIFEDINFCAKCGAKMESEVRND